MHIRRAKPDDARTLSDIALAGKRHWGYSERWIESWREILTLQPEFISKHETHAAVVDGCTVGFYSLCRQEDKLRLEHLWVLPDFMRQGVGRSLFAHALKRVRELRFHSLEIESDPNAEGFYRRMGARRVGTTVSELDGTLRQLPVLVYEIDAAA